MSKIKVNLTLTLSIPDEGLNVNSLFFGLKEISSKIMLEILKILFKAIEERTIIYIKNSSSDRIIRYGRQRARILKTSFGTFKYPFARIKNINTDQIMIPLREELKIPKYRQYQDESMESAIGLSVHLSYDRSEKEVERIKGTGASRWTVWRRLHEFSKSQCQFPDFKKIPYSFLMVDGTGVHLQGPGGVDIGQKRMRWALASTGVSQPFDIVGIWVDRSWKQIAQNLKRRLNYNKLEVLISDGGPGIEENLLVEGMRHQRCVLHGKRDFGVMLFQDGIKKKGQKPFVDFLDNIPAMMFTKARLEKISENDRPSIIESCKRTESCFKELIGMLD
ncbi:MAG: hypothetical protein JW708_10030, partial [Vallitaleaceae bacterium]|nr:hypothetical protein [Vallitaleaceae bacterium]